MNDDKNDCPDNYVIPGPELPNGDRLCISHHDGHKSDLGVIKKIKSGKPIPDDAKFLYPIEGTEFLQIGESISELKSKGPSKVNSKSYRTGYDRVFKNKNSN